jgi:hypothetical protein
MTTAQQICDMIVVEIRRGMAPEQFDSFIEQQQVAGVDGEIIGQGLRLAENKLYEEACRLQISAAALAHPHDMLD